MQAAWSQEAVLKQWCLTCLFLWTRKVAQDQSAGWFWNTETVHWPDLEHRAMPSTLQGYNFATVIAASPGAAGATTSPTAQISSLEGRMT